MTARPKRGSTSEAILRPERWIGWRDRLGVTIGRVASRRIANPLVRSLEGLNHLVHWGDPAPRRNGEERVLRLVGPRLRRVIDVGACEGDWTTLVRRYAPAAEVAVVEASSHARQAVARRFADDPLVRVAASGLADAEGERQFYRYRERPDLSSFVAFPHRLIAEKAIEGVTTGDAYVREQLGWMTIDYLKIDTEGLDLAVLEGFRSLLVAGAIYCVQFEYARANILSRSLLLDFYELLEPLGFDIGRIHPDGVEFRSYSLSRENFFNTNHLAIHQAWDDLRPSLEGRWRRH